MICWLCIIQARHNDMGIGEQNLAVTIVNGQSLCAEHMMPSVHQHIREN